MTPSSGSLPKKMKFTRRDFVKLGGFATIAAFGFSGSAFAGTNDDVLSNQTAESFRQLIGTEFYIRRERSSISARLVKVEDFPNKTKKGECFLLVFETSLKRVEQAIYNLYHPNIGNFELFMSEGLIGRRRTLVATINRL
jgi:hypothetical protein